MMTSSFFFFARAAACFLWRVAWRLHAQAYALSLSESGGDCGGGENDGVEDRRGGGNEGEEQRRRVVAEAAERRRKDAKSQHLRVEKKFVRCWVRILFIPWPDRY